MEAHAPTPYLDSAALRAIAQRSATAGCKYCRTLSTLCWEAMPAGFSESQLVRVGTLRRESPESEPTLDEYHPDGTRYGSSNAPIAANYFPYNLCDVWACKRCQRAFLRYTEYGGYYVQQRVRLLDQALIVDPAVGGVDG